LNSWIIGIGLEITQIMCYILLITVDDKIAKYIFVVFATAASQSFFPILWPGIPSSIIFRTGGLGTDMLMKKTERIRAARGTTAAGLAIGMTNVRLQPITSILPRDYIP
jgi:hypothetical protein